MASEWRASTWGEEISLEYGKSLRTHGDGRGQYRVFGSNGPIGWTDTPLAEGPGVILGRKGANRGVEYSAKDFFVIDTAYYVVPKTDLDMRWLYYAIKHHKLGDIDDGSPVPSTTRAAVYIRPVEVPPVIEQRAIAHILGTLDDKIELNRQMDQTLEEMARAVFKSWFVDFDPVRAKIDGRQPGEALPGLPAELYELFPERLVESELGEVPEGWEVRCVGDLVSLSRNSVTPQEYPEEVFDHYSIPAFDDGASPKAEPGASIKSNKYHVPVNAILISKLNPRIPRVWLPIVSDHRRSICSTEFLVVEPGDPRLRAWAYCMLDSAKFQSRFSALVTGTSGSHQRVRPDAFLALRVVVPPSAVRVRFGALAGAFLTRIESNRDAAGILGDLRDTLLPQLISGELRVPNARLGVAEHER